MANKERFTMIAAVYLLLLRQGSVLLLRRFQTGYADGWYSLVAGHVDGGEALRTAMAREAQEEAGITINPEALQHGVTMHRWCGDHERMDFYFTAAQWEGEVHNQEPQKCDDLSWFPLHQLPENTLPYIRVAIDAYQRGEQYGEFGWKL
ncbi:NUDIX domain-containing protein [Candidatus Uhrbacteria bacterium]|nr:NUDIX domain-containing protein [Candidatus Uhrbacteria bacterium]